MYRAFSIESEWWGSGHPVMAQEPPGWPAVVFAHTYAILTWLYAGFGIGELPWRSSCYGAGRFRSSSASSRCTAARGLRARTRHARATLHRVPPSRAGPSWAAWLVWNGLKAGAVLGLVLFPVEAVFWLGFALPIPWIFGIARAAFLALAWKTLD